LDDVHVLLASEALVHVTDGLADDVRRAQAGDDEAFGRLVESCWADLVRLARSVVGEAEAEDAVQDGLIAAWDGIRQLRDPARLRPWATRIVFRRCLRRTRWRRLRVALGALREPASRPDPESELSLWQLLSGLAPRQRAVLHMTVVEEMSDSEIGDALGLAPGSVRAHRRRAREALARRLGAKP
jgi:RNA polymerase sigma-70 factor (ECF subfamily)